VRAVGLEPTYLAAGDFERGFCGYARPRRL